jgi:hypothetical protein
VTTLSRNLQLEKESLEAFRTLLLPWSCTREQTDVGIDFIVRPFETRDRPDGSKDAVPALFQAQIKATTKTKSKSNTLGYYFDTKHLLFWKKMRNPLMLAVYSVPSKTFYYEWVEKVEIRENQTKQKILLRNPLTRKNKDQVMKDIIYFLDPPKVSRLHYTPKLREDKSNTIVAFGKVENIREVTDIGKVLSEQVPAAELEFKASLILTGLKEKRNGDPKNSQTGLLIAILCIILERYDEAKDELKLLIDEFKLPQGRILFNVFKDDKADIFQGMRTFTFSKYFKWEQDTPKGTEVITTAIIGNEEFVLKYDPKGVILPKQTWENTKFSFGLRTTDSTVTPTVKAVSHLMMTLLDKNGEPLYQYGVVLGTFDLEKSRKEC